MGAGASTIGGLARRRLRMAVVIGRRQADASAAASAPGEVGCGRGELARLLSEARGRRRDEAGHGGDQG